MACKTGLERLGDGKEPECRELSVFYGCFGAEGSASNHRVARGEHRLDELLCDNIALLSFYPAAQEHQMLVPWNWSFDTPTHDMPSHKQSKNKRSEGMPPPGTCYSPRSPGGQEPLRKDTMSQATKKTWESQVKPSALFLSRAAYKPRVELHVSGKVTILVKILLFPSCKHGNP